MARSFGLLLLLTVGCGVTPRAEVTERLARITPETCREQLASLLEIGPRFAGDQRATDATIAFLTARLESYGYGVIREDIDVTVGDVRQANLHVELDGTEDPRHIVQIGAHYDSVPNCPGADDNGSGVVGVLEAARVLAGHRPARTIRFSLFAAEELGLEGSAAHLVQTLTDEEQQLEGILVLEMIGFKSTAEDSQQAPIRIPFFASLPYVGNFILVAGNFSSGGVGNLFEYCAEAYVPELEYYSANRIAGFFGDSARSDHYPYWRAGLKGIMISDTANFRNPNYHRPTDTLDTIDFEFLGQVARASAATMVHWAE